MYCRLLATGWLSGGHTAVQELMWPAGNPTSSLPELKQQQLLLLSQFSILLATCLVALRRRPSLLYIPSMI